MTTPSDHRYEDPGDGEHPDRSDEWEQLRQRYLRSPKERLDSNGRGIHHQALVSSDVERTIAFYQELLGFPLTALFENRDYVGSTHFFFDAGNGNALAFFDFPGLGLDGYREVVGGHHHCAISVERPVWLALRERLAEADVPVHEVADASLYFQGPDGERIELIADPLGEMYGDDVL